MNNEYKRVWNKVF